MVWNALTDVEQYSPPTPTTLRQPWRIATRVEHKMLSTYFYPLANSWKNRGVPSTPPMTYGRGWWDWLARTQP